jgi:cysteine-rich repeat protein
LVCGDYAVDPGEECEDGNQAAGDGCSASCTLEGVCGNGLVEPGEACDGQTECVDCALTPASECFTAVTLSLGTNMMTSGQPLNGVGAGAGCASAVRSVGRLAIGSQATRIALFVNEAGDSYVLRSGCTGPLTLGGCGDGDLVTPVLPAHAVLWIGQVDPAVGTVEQIALQTVRFGSFFDSPDGMTDQSGAFAWTHGGGSWQTTIAGPGAAALQSPPIDLRGVPAPVLRLSHAVDNIAAASNRVEVSTNGTDWSLVASFPTAGTFTDAEVPIPGVADAPAVLLRFVAEGTGGWTLHEMFVGPPFVP